MLIDLPSPPDMTDVIWRPATEADAAAIVDLQNRCFEVDNTYREVESEILERFEDPMIHAQADSLLAERSDGTLIVSVWSFMPTTAETKWRAFSDVQIDPELRTPEMRRFCMDWWEARSRQRFARIEDALPRSLWLNYYEHQTDEIAFAKASGYTPSRYFAELLRDLSQPIEPRALEQSITVVPAEEARDGDELYVHNEAFRDHWGSQPWTVEKWEHFKNEFYLPSASFVAYDGEDPVGHVFSTAYPHDFDDRGWPHGWVDSLGVVRSHRKRGLASALVTRALESFVNLGFEYALLDVDSENPTGAYGMYEKLGFVLDRRTVTLLKEA